MWRPRAFGPGGYADPGSPVKGGRWLGLLMREVSKERYYRRTEKRLSGLGAAADIAELAAKTKPSEIRGSCKYCSAQTDFPSDGAGFPTFFNLPPPSSLRASEALRPRRTIR